MQDRYSGDHNDYVKYYVLRSLAAAMGGTQLGVCWYRTRPQVVDGNRGQNDGKHIAYLRRGGWQQVADPFLFDQLRELLFPGNRQTPAMENRTLERVQQLPIWPEGTQFFGQEVPTCKGYTGHGPAEYRRRRAQWHQNARRALAGCNVVFLDPDNSMDANWRKCCRGAKWASPEEVKDYFDSHRRTVVCISHPPRWPRLKHHCQTRELLGVVDGLFCSLYQGSCGFHFLVARPHRRAVQRCLLELAERGHRRRWGTWRYFDTDGNAVNPA